MKQFIFYYFMKNEKELIKKWAPEHASYWHRGKNSGGPFSDFSGGFICFVAKDDNDARAIANQDPFMKYDLLEHHWIKEWIKK